MCIKKIISIKTSPAQLRLAQISSEYTLVLIRKRFDRLSSEQTKLNLKLSFKRISSKMLLNSRMKFTQQKSYFVWIKLDCFVK